MTSSITKTYIHIFVVAKCKEFHIPRCSGSYFVFENEVFDMVVKGIWIVAVEE
jgi:hypothetical protein